MPSTPSSAPEGRRAAKTGEAPARASKAQGVGARAPAAKAAGPKATTTAATAAVPAAGSGRGSRTATGTGETGKTKRAGAGADRTRRTPAPDRSAAPTPQPVPGPSAFGAPGAPPQWAPGDKQGIGTCLRQESPVWFTLADGIVTEIYYPRVDLANSRDLQFLLAGPAPEDFYEERRDTDATIAQADPRALLWDVTTKERQGRFQIHKRVLTDPSRPALVMRVTITAGDGAAAPRGLTPYVLFAPHVADRGGENTARVLQVAGRTVLVAHRHDTYCALACSNPFQAASVGFVGASDGWTDLLSHRRLTWAYTTAVSGNVALTAQLGGDVAKPFSLAIGFGQTATDAVANAVAAADADFAQLETDYVAPWHRYCAGLLDLSRASHDGGRQYYLSAMVVRAHEDRENAGALIASLAIPWGDAQGDGNRAGYHLVWPRDLYHAATARLAAGDAAGALQTLHYLERTQREDGSWPQNFWVFGEPYWHGLQLDEIAFPILLAWQLRRADALDWNPYPSLIAPAAHRIARVGPVTQQERWEENSGYSPSTLAASIAALVCAAEFAHADRDPQEERYFLEVADYWARHLDDWTYTTCGSADGHSEYYERIAGALDPGPAHLGRAILPLANLPPQAGTVQEAAVVDGGFLELVRYGVRAADDAHVLQTLTVYDDLCRVDTPAGPCWHRYTYDGYGQKADGGPYTGTGVGRAWPLLTGERAHYALAAGQGTADLVKAMEAFTTAGGMIPEQVWDQPDMPERGMFLGRPTGSAAPLVWAHAEYIKLLRSIADGTVFDCPTSVQARYAKGGRRGANVVVWKHNHKIRAAAADDILRIEVYAPAALHWTRDSWRNVQHEPMAPYGHGVWIYDFPKGTFSRGHTLEFTFYWNDAASWEGSNYVIAAH